MAVTWPRISFGIIVFNGEPFTRYCLRALYPFAHEIIVVEGGHEGRSLAAGRNDGVRTGYSHWTRPLRRSKLGIMLRPDVDLDGDIFGTRLPRRSPVAMVAGRGYLAASGDVELVQVARPR